MLHGKSDANKPDMDPSTPSSAEPIRDVSDTSATGGGMKPRYLIASGPAFVLMVIALASPQMGRSVGGGMNVREGALLLAIGYLVTYLAVVLTFVPVLRSAYRHFIRWR